MFTPSSSFPVMVVMVSSVLELALLMPIGEGNGKGVVRRKVETTTESGVVVGFLAHIPVCVYVCVCVCVCECQRLWGLPRESRLM